MNVVTMKQLALFGLVSLVGCGGTPIGTNETPDEFALAAISWEGAHIREMIAVWNKPNDAYIEKGLYSDGYARWKQDTTESDCLERFPIRQTRVCYDAQRKQCEIVDRNQINRQSCEVQWRHDRNTQMHRCIVTASFAAAGIIYEVDVFSRRCSKVYAATIPFLTR